MSDILYDSNKYTIRLLNNKFTDDKFQIKLYDDLLSIQRIDTKCGWYQDLVFNLYNKLECKNKLLHIGKSDLNELSVPIDMGLQQTSPSIPICVGMAAVPPRFNAEDFLYRIDHILYGQTYEVDKLYITVPKVFNRFQECLSLSVLDKLRTNAKIEIIETDIDYGPASKFLGPLIYKRADIYNKFLVLLDDDRYYNNNLIENLFEAHKTQPSIEMITSDWLLFFDQNYIDLSNNYFKTRIEKRYMPGGFTGFALHLTDRRTIDSIVEYTLDKLNNIKDAFLHDEGILLGYIYKYNTDIMVVSHKSTYDTKRSEEHYALCTNGWIRKNIENNIIKDDKISQLNDLFKTQSKIQPIDIVQGGDVDLGVVSSAKIKDYDGLLFYDIFNNNVLINKILNNNIEIKDVYLLGSNIEIDENKYNISYIDRSIDCRDSQFATNTNYMIYKYTDMFLFLNLGTDVAVKWLLGLPTLLKFKQLILCFYDFIDGDIDSYIFLLQKLNRTHDLVYKSVSNIGFNEDITNRHGLSNIISVTFVRRS